jgi:phosphoglycerate dehydrogenase-like enzyme
MARSLAQRKMGEPQGKALQGLTVGLVGLGGIGRALIRRLKSFDVHLLGIKRTDPQKAKEDLGLDWAGKPDDLGELLGMADFVILCLPVTRETNQMMTRNTMALMKPGAYLINLSRGGLVDREALEEALSSGKIAGAGLDVFWEEPPDPEDPIFQYNVLATPHIGGSTDISIRGIVTAVAENIRRVARNQAPLFLQP